MTFNSTGPKASINVCLTENIDAESLPNNHYTFMSDLPKFISPMYRSIFDTLINNFDMEYDSIQINKYEEEQDNE